MYFGSVKFFKHLIIVVLTLSVLIPLTLAIVFGVQNRGLRREIDALNKIVTEQTSSTTVTPSVYSPTATEGVQEQQMQPDPVIPAATDIEFPYQAEYPNLYAKPKEWIPSARTDKKVYLTFDDGPSARTPEILDILDTYKIKATFFVVYKDDPYLESLYKEIVDRGHKIAIHTASHSYDEIYASVENYLADFNKIYNQIYEVTGQKVDLFRFPGGSKNGYNQEIRRPLIDEMNRRGFTYHDWNVSSTDAITAGKTTPTAAIVSETIKGVTTSPANKSVVLMHDEKTKTTTVEALPKIIEDLQADGHVFEKLDSTVKPFTMKLED